MKIHRFIGDFNLTAPRIDIHDKDLIKQIKEVLHLQKDEQVVLSNSQGQEIQGKIIDLQKDFISVEVLERRVNTNEPSNEVILGCAVLKKENFELVVQKVTEVGVKKIIPLITSRTIKLGLNLDRLSKIAKEAAEQSGRGTIPDIIEPTKFENVLSETKDMDIVLLDIEGKEPFQSLKKDRKMVILIGPEGGWTEDELTLAKEHNVKIASLGKLILRAETAAIIASFLVFNP